MAAMATSPTAPTMKGRAPCLKRSLRLVRRPTPAKVRRKAQRLRLPSARSWGLVKPRVADDPLRKCPLSDRACKFLFCLAAVSMLLTDGQRLPAYMSVSMSANVPSAWLKKSKTMPWLNSLSPGSSSISKICSKVAMSTLSPKSRSSGYRETGVSLQDGQILAWPSE